MNILQSAFEEALREQISFQKVGALLISRKLEEQGIHLSDAQIDQIEMELSNLEGDETTIEISDSQLASLGLPPEQAAEMLQLDIGDGDEMEELLENLYQGIGDSIPAIVSELSDLILKALKQDAPKMLSQRRGVRQRFESGLVKMWKKPLDLLETHLAIALEAGEEFNSEYRGAASEENNFVFEALTRLHARACQITSEVLSLLSSGHADGAHARWRSLHEIAVVGFFVKHHGNDCAEQYLLHDVVESYKAARTYQQHAVTLGYEAMTPEEFAEIESAYDSLVARFGKSYKSGYGWAASFIDSPRPTFRDIEESSGLDHLRPFYKMASHNVHANPKGVLFRLGLYPGSDDILLAGPSNTGLADPGHGTAISLGQITTALVTAESNIDHLVVCSILLKLQDEIGDEFLRVQKALEKEHSG